MNKASLAMFLVLVAAVTVLVGNQIFGSHKPTQIRPEVKIVNGNYDPDAILFAQKEIEKEIANSTLLTENAKGLGYLAYLAEGALCFPAKVDITRVRLLANRVQGVLDGANTLTEAQLRLVQRVSVAINTVSGSNAATKCPSR